MNKKQLTIRKDDADMRYATTDIGQDEIQGDSKWFLKRKALLQEQQA